MIRKLYSPIPGHVRIVFELPSHIWADRIFVAGDFNGWDETANPMRQDRDGLWQATLDLPAGSRCHFRYLIDGQWRTDYHADGCATNAYGAENSVVHADLPEMPALVAETERLLLEPVAATPPNPRPIAAPTERPARRPVKRHIVRVTAEVA